MNSKQDEYRHLMLWWGENALDWELKAWQKLQQSDAMSDIERVIEARTRSECDTIHSQLIAEGWELSSMGNGWMRRISVYRKLQSAD
jgi:hypothetical protein